jgi:hypothetical protein
MDNYILHFTSIESDSEYIVITSDSESSWEDHCLPGYELNHAYPIDDIGILPADRILQAR